VLIKFVQNAIGNFRIFMMVPVIYAGIKYITILIRSIKNLKLIDALTVTEFSSKGMLEVFRYLAPNAISL
jgi:hypothetical protein